MTPLRQAQQSADHNNLDHHHNLRPHHNSGDHPNLGDDNNFSVQNNLGDHNKTADHNKTGCPIFTRPYRAKVGLRAQARTALSNPTLNGRVTIHCNFIAMDGM